VPKSKATKYNEAKFSKMSNVTSQTVIDKTPVQNLNGSVSFQYNDSFIETEYALLKTEYKVLKEQCKNNISFAEIKLTELNATAHNQLIQHLTYKNECISNITLAKQQTAELNSTVQKLLVQHDMLDKQHLFNRSLLQRNCVFSQKECIALNTQCLYNLSFVEKQASQLNSTVQNILMQHDVLYKEQQTKLALLQQSHMLLETEFITVKNECIANLTDTEKQFQRNSLLAQKDCLALNTQCLYNLSFAEKQTVQLNSTVQKIYSQHDSLLKEQQQNNLLLKTEFMTFKNECITNISYAENKMNEFNAAIQSLQNENDVLLSYQNKHDQENISWNTECYKNLTFTNDLLMSCDKNSLLLKTKFMTFKNECITNISYAENKMNEFNTTIQNLQNENDVLLSYQNKHDQENMSLNTECYKNLTFTNDLLMSCKNNIENLTSIVATCGKSVKSTQRRVKNKYKACLRQKNKLNNTVTQCNHTLSKTSYKLRGLAEKLEICTAEEENEFNLTERLKFALRIAKNAFELQSLLIKQYQKSPNYTEINQIVKHLNLPNLR